MAYHPECGVFVGHAMGFAFWSKLDTAGQWCVPVFSSVKDFKRFLVPLYESTFVNAVTFHKVQSNIGIRNAATVSDMLAASPPIPKEAIDPFIPNLPN